MSELRGKQYVLQKIQQRGVGWVELRHRLGGAAAGSVFVAAGELDAVLEDGLDWCDGDALLVPDVATFVCARAEREGEERPLASLVCDVQRVDGAPHPLCVRSALKRVLARLAHHQRYCLGASIAVRWCEAGVRRPTAVAADKAERLGHRLARQLEREGCGVRAWGSVESVEQQRFVFHATDPLALADTLATFHRLATAVGVAENARAVFRGSGKSNPHATRLELLLGVDGGEPAPWDDGLTSDGLSAEGRLIAERFTAMAGALKWVLRRDPVGMAAAEPFPVRARPAPRVGDASMLAIGGVDAGVDPYLAVAAVLAVVGQDALPEAAEQHVPSVEDASIDTLAGPRHAWLGATLGDAMVEALLVHATVRVATQETRIARRPKVHE